MRITDKGQVTIPKAVREQMGLQPGDEVDFIVQHDGEVRLVRVAGDAQRARRIIANLANRGDVPMTTDEIMELTRGD